MASETVYQINYANVSDLYCALTASAMPASVNAVKQIALWRGQRTTTSIMSRDMLVQVVYAWLNCTTDQMQSNADER